MTDDTTGREGDDTRLDEAADQGPVTEGLDTRDTGAGDPDRIRELPPQDRDPGKAASATGTDGNAAGLAGGAGVSAEATNPETRRVADGEEVDDGDAVAMPTEPAGGSH
jgi:hypothetical protein